MKNSAFLSLLTASLALGSVTQPQTNALEVWADKYLPELTTDAEELLSPPFTLDELQIVAQTAVEAAQELKGLFAGVERARIAQTILVVAAKAALPDQIEPWICPFLEGPGLTAIIESAFQKSLREGSLPVVDGPELPKGGIQ